MRDDPDLEWVEAARSHQAEMKERSAIAEELDFWKEKCKHLELQNRGRGQNRFEENRNRERPEF